MSEKKINGIALDGASIPSMQLFTKGASIPTMQNFNGIGSVTAGAQIPVMQLAPVTSTPTTTQSVSSSSQSGSNSQGSVGATKDGSK